MRIRKLLDKKNRMKYVYGKYCKHNVDSNTILFESFHGKEVSDSPLALAIALLNMPEGKKYHVYFSTNNIERDQVLIDSLDINIELVHIHSNKYAKLLATAGILINNSSFPSYLIRRDSQIYLQTWHGTPLKTLGKKMAHGIETMHNVQHNFLQASHLVFPNEFTRKTIMRDYNLEKLFCGKVIMTGYPRNNIFSNKTRSVEIKEHCGDTNITTLAYMPTWRGSDNQNINVSDYAKELKSILLEIDSNLTCKQKMYVNLHPTVRNLISIDNYKHIFKFPDTIEKYEFINSMDALVTDYSSIFFDYSITGKPIILFMYDYDHYMSERGMYFDVQDLPFKKIYSTADFIECIRTESFKSEHYLSDKAYLDKYIPYDSIDTAQKIMEYLLNKETDLLIRDYSTNLEKKWNIVRYSGNRTPQDIEAFSESLNPNTDLAIFHSSAFDVKMSKTMHDKYADSYNYIFATNSIPMTYSEIIRKRFSKTIRKDLYLRDEKRIAGDLTIASSRTYNFQGVSLETIRTSGNDAIISFSYPESLGVLKDINLSFRSNVDNFVHHFTFSLAINNGKVTVTARIDLSRLESGCVYWDCNVILNNGENVVYPITISKKYSKIFAIRFIQVEKNGEITFPHISLQRNLAFTHREKTPYDTRMIRFKEIIAFMLYKVNKPFWQRKKLWLVFEKFSAMAQDNGYYFFKYCMENLSPEEKSHIYYVMDKSSPDWEKVSCFGKNVIPFMSFKHILYNLVATLYIGSDSKKHLYVWRAKPNLISSSMRRKPIYFLQHGVTALKKVDGIFGANGSSPMTYFTTTSEFEQKIIVDNFGYTKQQTPVTGFTRWDVLEDKSSPDEKIILVMPTWRSWLEERSVNDFLKSDYFINYSTLIQDKSIDELLKKNKVKMVFYIHPKFREYLTAFNTSSENIELVPQGSRPLNELMMKCSMLITDYSSVCWDVYYMGKPVLFYQFDYQMYMDNHDSYIDMENELFGIRCVELSEVITGIKNAINCGFEEDIRSKEMRPYYFKYIDNDNSKRTYEYLKNKGY